MIGMLLEQSVRGALAVGAVWLADRLLAPTVRAESRRWLWLLAALVFLTPWKVALLPATARDWDLVKADQAPLLAGPLPLSVGRFAAVPWPAAVWLAGATLYLAWLAALTVAAQRRWARERLCTETRLLELLEDAKRSCGVTAPIGLVVTEQAAAPALLGWLRPRILLPPALASSLSAAQLRAVLLHELAHFRRLDLPMGWLLALVTALHWFNPLAWLLAGEWRKFREEAADEAVLALLPDAGGELYGGTLLAVLRGGNGVEIPFGALAVGESMRNLKRRMVMIKNYRNKTAGRGLVGLGAALLAALALLVPARAETEQDQAVKVMRSWVQLCDEGKYEQSWDASADWFKTRITRDHWINLLKATRPALGKNLRREVGSVMPMRQLPAKADGSELRDGEFVVVIFNSAFENMKEAAETVAFEKTAGGGWQAVGYYIKPR